MPGTRWIKTKRETMYRLLVESVEDPPDRSPDHDVYPFQYAYELFTAGLVVGYLENERFEGEYEGDGDHHQWIRFSQFAENHPDHLACVDLFEKLIRLEHEGQQGEDEDGGEEEAEAESDSSDGEEEGSAGNGGSDGEEDGSDDSVPAEVTWDHVVGYADKGVGMLFAEWNDTEKFDLQQYFSSVGHDVEDRFDIFEDLLTERPTTGNQGDVSL